MAKYKPCLDENFNVKIGLFMFYIHILARMQIKHVHKCLNKINNIFVLRVAENMVVIFRNNLILFCIIVWCRPTYSFRFYKGQHKHCLDIRTLNARDENCKLDFL